MNYAGDVPYILIHVIPDEWGPFVDVRAMWLSRARHRGNLHVITPAEFCERQNAWYWNEPRAVFILWTLIDPGPLDLRKSKVFHVFFEAIDHDLGKLLPAHVDHWDRFKTMSVHFDGVFVHTPRMKEVVSTYIQTPVHVMPLGWDAEAMGTPRWEAPKHRGYVFHGSMVGRREVIVPYLNGPFGLGHGSPSPSHAFENVTGMFGRSLLGVLDTASASLYIAHSQVGSFSTWRLWQAASTSAVMIAEVSGDDGDTWPFVAGEHFYPIEMMTADNASIIVGLLRSFLLEAPAMIEISKRAHELACTYSLARIEDEFILPAIERTTL